MGTRRRVAVIGCGVVGLSSAVLLREAGHEVRLVGAESPERTVSAVAGAIWFPYKVDPPELVTRWAAESRPVFDGLARDGAAGVVLRECVQLWRQPNQHPPWWASAVPDLRALPTEALPAGFADSYLFEQPVIDMRRYLPYLRERFRLAGGTIDAVRLESLRQADDAAEVVVNCTGLAARGLAGDPAMHPIRGQWVRVRNPGIDRVLTDLDHPEGSAYIVPHPTSCVLGGSADAHEWDTTVDTALAERILRRCAELDPRLADAGVLEHRVGLRPARSTGVRLEPEPWPDGRLCVHNYGHGGAGVTLSWGCAAEVLRIVDAGG